MSVPVALVGCGYWGKNLARNFAQLEALAYLCDADPGTLRAAILRVKLRHLDAWTRRRVELASEYERRLAPLDVVLPTTGEGASHVFHVYVIRVRDRQAVQAHLQARQIGTAIYYPRPLHELEPCQPFAKHGPWPHSETASRETLALPFFPEMTEAQLDAVAAALADVVPRRR